MVAVIAPSLLPATSAHTAQQRAQAGGVARTKGTFWYLKSIRCPRNYRESKVNCLAVAIKASMSSATFMYSAASDWQNVCFLSDHSLLFCAVNTVFHLIYRFFYSFAIKYLNWNSFYNDYALSLQQNNFLTECRKAEAFRELVDLQGRTRPLWCSLVSGVWGHFCLCTEWETAEKTGEIMNLPRRCTFWLKSLGIKPALQQSQHPSPSLSSWQLEDMPGRSLMLHIHVVQLLPSFSDTQSIHNIHISILFPHSEIPS